MRALTSKQQRVLEFIRRCIRSTGNAPTYRQIAGELRVDVRSAYQHVEALERKGVLERVGGRIELAGEFRAQRGVPVVGRIAAGSPILATEHVEEYVDLKGELDDEDLFFLRVNGDSMIEAGINDGDLVLVRQQPTVRNGEIAAVIIGEEATVKRVRITGSRLRLEPANPRYTPMEYGPDDDVRIAGKVIMAIRRV